MNPWLWQLRLALCAGLCCMVGSAAWSQAPAKTDTPAAPAAVTNQGCAAPTGVVTEVAPPLAETRPLGSRIHDTLHRYGVGCFATINTVGCTSLGSELTFIFGSCRAFFQEPCAPGGGLTHGCGPNGCP